MGQNMDISRNEGLEKERGCFKYIYCESKRRYVVLHMCINDFNILFLAPSQAEVRLRLEQNDDHDGKLGAVSWLVMGLAIEESQ